MTEKIKWYQEVLELEPNSKVFFPLARMLAEEDMTDEAIAVLETGLEKHPEYLEARLFIIELLYTSQRQEECAAQVNRLSKMFSSYAGFWQAWAACLSQEPSEEDAASILRFLAANFISGPLKLHDVINRGLAVIAAEKKASVASDQSKQPELQSPQELQAASEKTETASAPEQPVMDMASGMENPETESVKEEEVIVTSALPEQEEELPAVEISSGLQDDPDVRTAEELPTDNANGYAIDEQDVILAENVDQSQVVQQEGNELELPEAGEAALAEEDFSASQVEPESVDEHLIAEQPKPEPVGENIVARADPAAAGAPQMARASLEENVADVLAAALKDEIPGDTQTLDASLADDSSVAGAEVSVDETLADMDIPEVPDLDAAGDFMDVSEGSKPAEPSLDEENAFDAMIDSLAERAELLDSDADHGASVSAENQIVEDSAENEPSGDTSFVDAELDDIFDEMDRGKSPSGGALDAEASVVGETVPEEAPDVESKVVFQEDTDEKISLRTRSMAEVLAEQGDIQGALDIYHELASTATDEREAEDIRRRVTTLQGRLEAAEAADANVESLESKKLIGMLQSLAKRVEARVAN